MSRCLFIYYYFEYPHSRIAPCYVTYYPWRELETYLLVIAKKKTKKKGRQTQNLSPISLFYLSISLFNILLLLFIYYSGVVLKLKGALSKNGGGGGGWWLWRKEGS